MEDCTEVYCMLCGYALEATPYGWVHAKQTVVDSFGEVQLVPKLAKTHLPVVPLQLRGLSALTAARKLAEDGVQLMLRFAPRCDNCNDDVTPSPYGWQHVNYGGKCQKPKVAYGAGRPSWSVYAEMLGNEL